MFVPIYTYINVELLYIYTGHIDDTEVLSLVKLIVKEFTKYVRM